MKLPRDLSGRDLISALCRRWGYVEVNQVGSHVILQAAEPSPHRIAVPAHKAVRIGTLNGILKDVANHKGVDRQAILDSL
jgi:predicted RNA binding protein YcfA (HicA-like mRNA interferase family)